MKLLFLTLFLICLWAMLFRPKQYRRPALSLVLSFGLVVGVFYLLFLVQRPSSQPILAVDDTPDMDSYGHRELVIDGDSSSVRRHSRIQLSSEAQLVGDANGSRLSHDSLINDTKYSYSPSTPLTADIYPSIAQCARPLAFQLANEIRESSQFSPQTAFTFEIIKGKQPSENHSSDHSSDDTHGQPTDSFRSAFILELLEQFPQGKFVIAKEVSAEATNQDFQKLAIQLSNTASKSDPPSGSVQAIWVANDKTNNAKASVDYIAKQWVNSVLSQSRDPKSFAIEYRSRNYRKNKNQIIGFTSRFARSQQEASSLALQNAIDFHLLPYGPNPPSEYQFKVIDRFQQKLSMPYGELWQEAVLVAPSHQDRIATATSRPMTVRPAVSGAHVYVRSNRSASGVLMIFMVAGAFGVAWVSNLLTQGYYRQTINYTLVTTIAVIVGLSVLALLFIVRLIGSI